jgi:DNA-binding NtrC family response regulator
VAENWDQPIDLLLTDVVMPRMNGRDLYQTLAPRQPGMKVLFMSGYLNELVANCSSLGPDTALLQKPFTVQTLTEKVRHVLDA